MFNFNTMLKHKLRFSFKTVKCSPYDDQVAALNALIDFKLQEISLINEQLMCYHRLLDFTINYDGSYLTFNRDTEQSNKALPRHYCQGHLIRVRPFQNINIRTCNNLCYLNKDAHEKLRTTELLMGSLEYRKKLISDEIQAAKDQIAHITDSRVIRYK